MPDTRAPPGLVIWIEGLPGAGKSTLSGRLSEMLAREGFHVEMVDGRVDRTSASSDLGFSRKDRETHARRVSAAARALAEKGAIVLVAMVTPYETARQTARATVGEQFVEVWLKCPVEVCRTRDPDGVYSRAEGGLLQHLTGVDDPFEDPLDPDIVVDSSRLPAEAVARSVFDQLHRGGRLALARAAEAG